MGHIRGCAGNTSEIQIARIVRVLLAGVACLVVQYGCHPSGALNAPSNQPMKAPSNEEIQAARSVAVEFLRAVSNSNIESALAVVVPGVRWTSNPDYARSLFELASTRLPKDLGPVVDSLTPVQPLDEEMAWGAAIADADLKSIDQKWAAWRHSFVLWEYKVAWADAGTDRLRTCSLITVKDGGKWMVLSPPLQETGASRAGGSQ